MGQINLVGVSGGANFEKLVEGETTIAKGTTNVDLSDGASFAGVLDDFDLIVVQVSGTLANASTSYADYVGVGGISGGIGTIYACDIVCSAGATEVLSRETFWLERQNAKTWRKEYRRFDSANYLAGSTTVPLSLYIKNGYLSGTISWVAYGCRFMMQDASAAAGSSGTGTGGGGGEEIEIPGGGGGFAELS